MTGQELIERTITWMQPRGPIWLMVRMRGGQASREVKTCVFAVTFGFMAFWFVGSVVAIFNQDTETMNPIEALAFSIFCGFLFACLYQLHWLGPSQVILDDEAIVAAGRFRRRYRYDQIAGVRFDTVRWRTITVRIMQVARHHGRDIVLGVPASLALPEVIDFLARKGVEVMDATPTADDLAQERRIMGTAGGG